MTRPFEMRIPAGASPAFTSFRKVERPTPTYLAALCESNATGSTSRGSVVVVNVVFMNQMLPAKVPCNLLPNVARERVYGRHGNRPDVEAALRRLAARPDLAVLVGMAGDQAEFLGQTVVRLAEQDEGFPQIR